jgi:hypothetical protein
MYYYPLYWTNTTRNIRGADNQMHCIDLMNYIHTILAPPVRSKHKH